MKKELFFLTMILFSILISSCNFLAAPKHGRENPNDPQAQIYNLFAYQSAPDEATVSFTWRDLLYNNDDDEKIEEAVLVYNVGEALPIRSIPLPPDSGGTVGFDYKDGISIYSKTVNGLSEGDKVYFAIYPKTKKQWLAPLYETITIRDPVEIPLIADPSKYPADPVYQLYWDGWMNEVPSGSSYWLSNSEYPVLRFNLPDRIRCTQALLTLPGSFSDSGVVLPVMVKNLEYVGDSQRLETFDYSQGSPIASFNTMPIDVTEAVNAAIIHGTDTLVIVVDTTSQSLNHDIYTAPADPPSTEYLMLTYEQF